MASSGDYCIREKAYAKDRPLGQGVATQPSLLGLSGARRAANRKEGKDPMRRYFSLEGCIGVIFTFIEPILQKGGLYDESHFKTTLRGGARVQRTSSSGPRMRY